MRYLTIQEIHIYLKKNGAIFPRNIGKEAFTHEVQKLLNYSSKYLVDQRTKRKNKIFNILSEKIFENNGEIDHLFIMPERSYRVQTLNSLRPKKKSEEKVLLTDFSWEQLKRIFKINLRIENDENIEDFFFILDPFYSNKISLDQIKDLLQNEIIEAKM